MSIAQIKKLNEKIPYWMKRPFAGIIRNKLIENSLFQETYQMLCQADKAGQKEKERLQTEKLRETLRHAYHHTAYYRELFDSLRFDPETVTGPEQLEKLPVLTKRTLKERMNDRLADDIADAYLVTTGGTTGEPTKVYMEKKAIYREWAFIYHFWSRYGYDYRKSRLATFRGVDMHGKISEINPLYAEIRLNPYLLNEDNFEQYLRLIERYRADFLYGYPSAIYNFCQIARKKGISLTNRFKAALLISENLYPFQEEMIQSVLGCSVAIFYGHSERAVFAERDERGYLFNALYGVTQFAKDNTLLVTGFINQKTPLIRYCVDDAVTRLPSGGYSVTGHWEREVLHGKRGERISMAAINFHDDTFTLVKGYQFVQDEVGKCTLRVVPERELSPGEIEKIHDRVMKKIGSGFECQVVPVSALTLTGRGKGQLLIQNIKDQD